MLLELLCIFSAGSWMSYPIQRQILILLRVVTSCVVTLVQFYNLILWDEFRAWWCDLCIVLNDLPGDPVVLAQEERVHHCQVRLLVHPLVAGREACALLSALSIILTKFFKSVPRRQQLLFTATRPWFGLEQATRPRPEIYKKCFYYKRLSRLGQY